MLQIVGDIDLEKYNLKSKLIIPLDEYLGIDKLPFKVSLKMMMEIAFWGQNQPSFQKASEIIYRVYGIKISYVTVMNITKYVGKLVYNYNYNIALNIWNNRANMDISIAKKKGTLYIQADGAAVNTRIEDENGSTWKENKLGIFFSDDDMYKRKDKSNIINHKEYVSYIGNVETFKILVFAKAVELKYWKYESIVFISDGATWLRNLIEELFPEAIQILDKFHLIENIYDYGKYIFNEDMKKTEKFKDKIIGYCYSREYNLIVKELKKYKDVTIPKTVCNLPVYLENNKNKIDYSTYEHNGWFVGSGAIESSNKTVIQLRLKQAGMRWSVDGANYMIALRCMWESDHWNEIEKIVTDYLY
ncbi:TPA: hypothetical protein IAB29_06950 [Candidatus Ventrenecus stercoripullorum]|nr:hypothetical protein [Candidatus Ventrenecus stercoripullorum]